MLELSAKQRIIAALLILIPVLLYWGFSGTPNENTATTSELSEKIDYFIEQAATKEWDKDGQLALALTSENVEHDPTASHSHLIAPKSLHYRENNPPVQVTAKTGIAKDDNSRIDLAGNVIVHDNSTSDQPTVMKTEALTVYQTNEYAETDQPVSISSPSGNIEGVGMDIQFQDRILNLHSQVKGIHINAQ